MGPVEMQSGELLEFSDRKSWLIIMYLREHKASKKKASDNNNLLSIIAQPSWHLIVQGAKKVMINAGLEPVAE